MEHFVLSIFPTKRKVVQILNAPWSRNAQDHNWRQLLRNPEVSAEKIKLKTNSQRYPKGDQGERTEAGSCNKFQIQLISFSQ